MDEQLGRQIDRNLDRYTAIIQLKSQISRKLDSWTSRQLTAGRDRGEVSALKVKLWS